MRQFCIVAVYNDYLESNKLVDKNLLSMEDKYTYLLGSQIMDSKEAIELGEVSIVNLNTLNINVNQNSEIRIPVGQIAILFTEAGESSSILKEYNTLLEFVHSLDYKPRRIKMKKVRI